MKFSSGHFTIFSETDRETLHGHNFQLGCVLESCVGDNGLAFDYSICKTILGELCKSLDERLLLPEKSPYLTIRVNQDNVRCSYNAENFEFPIKDIVILPVKNISVEELSNWFLMSFLTNSQMASISSIEKVEMIVSSSKSQRGVSLWEKN